jgi:hypothetical protein
MSSLTRALDQRAARPRPPLLEVLLDARAVEQIEHAPDPQRVLEVAVAA